VFDAAGKAFATTFGVAMNVAFVLFVGVFLAVKPDFYRDGLARLFPPGKRQRVVEILDEVGENLFSWLQGRAATMIITGTGTGLVLWMLGVPLALTLGLVTGVLTFIPTIGGILSLLLSMLVALPQGTSIVMWVVLAYLLLQFLESNVITPLIQQHQTAIPPPILLSAQLMMGVLTGFLGVLVATPLVAASIVLVREAYIRDVLEREDSLGQTITQASQ
jgi:predicted PurR-regulated permease PerM